MVGMAARQYILAMKPNAYLALLLPMFLLSGCSTSHVDTFDIEVRNATTQPLLLSLAKDGPPYEPAWATPEDLAIESPKRREQWAGGPQGMGLVPPGKSALVKGLKGTFEKSTRAFLRAYAGDLTISQMLAKSRESPDRVDIALSPGANQIVVSEKAGRLVAGSN